MDSILFDINHLQEVLINIKKAQEMEKEINKLKKEIEILKDNNYNLEGKYIKYCQDLVNYGLLEMGKEPYLSKYSRRKYYYLC